MSLLADGPELGAGIELGRVAGAARRWLVPLALLGGMPVLSTLARCSTITAAGARSELGRVVEGIERSELGAVVEIEGIEPERAGVSLALLADGPGLAHGAERGPFVRVQKPAPLKRRLSLHTLMATIAAGRCSMSPNLAAPDCFRWGPPKELCETLRYHQQVK